MSCSLLMRECMFTVSNALLISRETRTVRSGGALRLKPFAIVFVMLCSAVTVECLVLKPCW